MRFLLQTSSDILRSMIIPACVTPLIPPIPLSRPNIHSNLCSSDNRRSSMQRLPIHIPITVKVKPEDRRSNFRQNFHPLHFLPLVISTSEYIAPFLRLRSWNIGKYCSSSSTIRNKVHEKRSLTVPWSFDILASGIKPIIMTAKLLTFAVPVWLISEVVSGVKSTLRPVDFRVFERGYGLGIGLRVVQCSLWRHLRRFAEVTRGSREMRWENRDGFYRFWYPWMLSRTSPRRGTHQVRAP